MSLQGRIIPLPTKKVITTFHFSNGEKTSIISKSNQSIDQTKSDILNSIACAYMAFPDLVISTDKITHITLKYKENLSIEDFFRLILLSLIYVFILIMIFAITTYLYFKITGKA